MLEQSETDLAAYDQFVDQSPQGILYCHTWWLDAVAPGRYEILTVTKGDRIAAAWPVVWAEGHRRWRMRMPLLTQKLGVLFAPSQAKYAERLSEEHRLMDELLGQLPPGAYLDQRFHENFTNWLPFYWHGCRQTTRYTYVLEDVSDLQAVWAGMRHGLRKKIRGAEKAGVHIRETEDLERFYDLSGRTFAYQGMRIPYGLELVSRIDEACRKHAGRKILIAEGPDGRAQACLYIVYDHRCAISAMGGTDKRASESGAARLLEWEAIRFASTVCRRYDFEGSMMRPIEQFFREFGGRQTPYFHIWGAKRPKYSPRRLLGRALHKIARIVDQ